MKISVKFNRCKRIKLVQYMLCVSLWLAGMGIAGAGSTETPSGGKPTTQPTKPPSQPTVSEPTMPGAIRGKAEPSTLQNMGSKARNINTQVRSLQANVSQSGWNSSLQTNNINGLRGAVAALQQDLTAFQTTNRARNFQDAVKLSNNLQQHLNQVNASLNSLAGARDTKGAQQGLNQIAISLGNIIQNIDTLPPCCTERTCCYVGFQ